MQTTIFSPSLLTVAMETEHKSRYLDLACAVSTSALDYPSPNVFYIFFSLIHLYFFDFFKKWYEMKKSYFFYHFPM